MTATLSSRYAALVASAEIEHDPAQEAVVGKLEALEAQLREQRLARKSSALGWLFGRREAAQERIRGLYLFGEVGRGKTMLMDLFYDTSMVEHRRRAHFHEFMLDVHERIQAYRHKIKWRQIEDEGPIKLVGAELADETSLLCFDEFHVTDIADAMILGRLFAQLFADGVVLVATSNVEPDELYKDGLNRALFLPFIAQLREQMEVVRLAAPKDFRLEKLAGQPAWYVPADEDAEVALDNAWQRLTGTLSGEPTEIAAK